MVQVDFVDGTREIFETVNSIYTPWRYQKEEQCFLIRSIEGDALIPAAFIKCMRHYKVEEE